MEMRRSESGEWMLYEVPSNGMTFEMMIDIVVQALQELDLTILDDLDGNAIYSHDFKFEKIEELDHYFNVLKAKGIKQLKARESQCKFCYPEGKAYSFYNPTSGEFIVRYVMDYKGKTDEGENIYVFQQCTNNPIQTGSDGIPF